MNEKSIQISYITNFKEYVYLFVYILINKTFIITSKLVKFI